MRAFRLSRIVAKEGYSFTSYSASMTSFCSCVVCSAPGEVVVTVCPLTIAEFRVELAEPTAVPFTHA